MSMNSIPLRERTIRKNIVKIAKPYISRPDPGLFQKTGLGAGSTVTVTRSSMADDPCSMITLGWKVA